MSAKRLMFAKARGARLQRDYCAMGYMQRGFQRTERDDGWRDHHDIPYSEHFRPETWRIHPDDAHLEYGPLSTALIRRVTTMEGPPNGLVSSACSVACRLFSLESEWWDLDGDDRMMSMLFIAEALADEGL
jgi:hypothetical protein